MFELFQKELKWQGPEAETLPRQERKIRKKINQASGFYGSDFYGINKITIGRFDIKPLFEFGIDIEKM